MTARRRLRIKRTWAWHGTWLPYAYRDRDPLLGTEVMVGWRSWAVVAHWGGES